MSYTVVPEVLRAQLNTVNYFEASSVYDKIIESKTIIIFVIK